MAQCCYKTHREDPQTFPKIDAVSTSQYLFENTEGISKQCPNGTREFRTCISINTLSFGRLLLTRDRILQRY